MLVGVVVSVGVGVFGGKCCVQTYLMPSMPMLGYEAHENSVLLPLCVVDVYAAELRVRACTRAAC